MRLIRCAVLFLVAVSTGVASSALAADPPKPGTTSGRPSPGPSPITVAPAFHCSITPPSGPPKPYQFTSITIKKTSGLLASDTKVVVRLGLQASGRVLANFCGKHFKNDQISWDKLPIDPPITDPNYVWLCNAAASGKCLMPPEVPKKPR